MRHSASEEDRSFARAFEACEVPPESFDHAAHVRLDSNIMLKHYSAEVLFSPKARQSFVQPNISPIPEQ